MIHISVCLPQCLQIYHPLGTNVVSFNHVDAKAKGYGENTLHLLVLSSGCKVILLSRALTADTLRLSMQSPVWPDNRQATIPACGALSSKSILEMTVPDLL